MALLQRIVYRSKAASVTDVLAFGREKIPVREASVAFVRSGYFVTAAAPAAIVDVNYAVFGSQREALLAGDCKHICACTIVEVPGFDQTGGFGGCFPSSPRAFLLHAQLLSDARRRHGDPGCRALDLLGELRLQPAVPFACTHSGLVTQIRRLINDQTSTRIPLAAIAREFYVSRFMVSRVFHRETGMRLRDYALRLRLRRSLSLLLHTNISLTDVAMELGFYDEPHFSKAFRNEFGMSPQSVRKYCTRSDFC